MNDQPSAIPTEPTPLPSQPKGGAPTWVWVLVGVGGLLAVVGIIFVVFVVIGLAKPKTTTTTNVSNTVTTNTATPPANTSTSTNGIVTYMTGFTDVMKKVGAAKADWTTAADKGKAQDIPASNAAVNLGITEITAAETLYAALVPTPETTKLHGLLKEAVDLMHTALNKALLGNVNEDAVTIQESKDAIKALEAKLKELQTELDAISKNLPAS